jgi:hypothetical protein
MGSFFEQWGELLGHHQLGYGINQTNSCPTSLSDW